MRHAFISVFLMGLVCGFVSVGQLACHAYFRREPAWVTDKQHDDFPIKSFMVGIGTGDSLSTASQKAQSDFAGTLRRALANRLLTLPGPTGTSCSWFHPRDRHPDFVDLVPKLAASWQSRDGKKHAALVTMERASAGEALLRRIRSLDSICLRESNAAARALRQENKPYLALKAYLSSLASWAEAEVLRVMVPLISSVKTPVSTCTLARNSMAMVEQLITGLTIRCSSRDLQQPPNESDLSPTLLISVAYTEGGQATPVFHVPIRIFQPGKKPEIKTRTGMLGLSTIESSSETPGIKITLPLKITVQLDGHQILSDAGIKHDDPLFDGLDARLDKLQACFGLPPIEPARIRIALLVAETTSLGQKTNASLYSYLSSRLYKQGFMVRNPASFIKHSDTLPSIELALAEVKNLADILIFGQLEIHLGPRINKDFFLARARGALRALAVESGLILTTFNTQATGAGLDLHSAEQRALSAFARNAFPVLLKAIKEQARAHTTSADPNEPPNF